MSKKKRTTKSSPRRSTKSDLDYAPILLAGGAGLAVYFLTKKKGGGEDDAARLAQLQTELAALEESMTLEFEEMNAKLNTAAAAGVAVEDAEMSTEMAHMSEKEKRWQEIVDEILDIIKNWPPPGTDKDDDNPWNMLTLKGLIPDWLRTTLIAAGIGYGGYRLYQWFTNRINKGSGKPPSVNCSVCGGTVTSSDWDTMDQTLQAHLMAYHPVNMGNALAVLPGVRTDLYSLPYWAQGVVASEAHIAYFYSQPVEYWGTNFQDNPWLLFALMTIVMSLAINPAMVALIPEATGQLISQTASKLAPAFAG